MRKETLQEPVFAEEIVKIIRFSHSIDEMREQLRDYHGNNLAQSLNYLSRAERSLLYSALDAEWLAEIISYIDDPAEYVDEIGIDKLAAIINYICIRQAMHELVRQAGENDNIATIYMVDNHNRFCGAIDLKDLIVARENVPLDSIISYAYPYLLDHEKISESIEKIKDYAEDSLPVLNKDKRIIGIITAQDVVEAADDELGEDYAKLAGLSAEEDLNETTKESMKKRLPWLIFCCSAWWRSFFSACISRCSRAIRSEMRSLSRAV